jgi:hypothetical protein
MELTAVFEPDSAAGTVVINEINYNSNNDFDPGDWVEIFNNSPGGLDISDWQLIDEADSNVFIFPEGSFIESSEYLVIVRDSMDFAAQFPGIGNYIGETGFGLSSMGDTLLLIDSDYNRIDSVAYLPSGRWPFQPDGNGPTLELKNPRLDNSDPDNWTASILLGTPGKINSSYLVISDSVSVQNTGDYDFGKIQNYPNPFNSYTNFDYRINFNSNVKINVFNILGEKVAALVDKNQVPGVYTIFWNGRNSSGYDLPSGIYIYVYVVNYEIAEIKKMVKMK